MSWPAASGSAAPPEHGADVGTLRLGAEAGSFRRSVRPATWVVLEELALAAGRDSAGRLVAPLSVRALADRLGLAKDTAGRALGWPADAGIARFEAGRQGGGRFGAGGYVLDLGSTGIRVGGTVRPRPKGADTAGAAARSRDATTESPRHDNKSDLSSQHQLDLFTAELSHDDTDKPAQSRLPDPTAMTIEALAPAVPGRVPAPAWSAPPIRVRRAAPGRAC